MQRSYFALPALILVIGLVAAPVTAESQTRAQVWEPDSALAALERGEMAAAWVISAAFGENLDSYSGQERALLLDGVERVARGSYSGDFRPMSLAFTILGVIVRDPASHNETRRLIPARLLRMYHQAERREAKGFAVRHLGRLLPENPPESDEILALLARIASLPAIASDVPPQTAIDNLLLGGPRGIETLRRLHEEDRIADPRMKVYVQKVAEGGYTHRPYRPR